LRQTVGRLENLVNDLTKRLSKLEVGGSSSGAAAKASAPAAAAPAKKEDDDDGVDLFGSDDEEEDAEAARVREERLAAYAAKKSKKPTLIAKSNLILDVKCWDDETDMKELEAAVRSVTCDGLLWGASKLVPLAYGIQKLQISCVVEDEKVSIDWLVDEIQSKEDFVQSVDIAAFNKI
jgi:elongation factor 1-delta